MARDPLDTVRSILMLARRPGTPGEGEAAIGRAVALMKAHNIPRSAVASFWPTSIWDFEGRPISSKKPRVESTYEWDAAADEALLEDLYDITTAGPRSDAEMLEALMRATKGKYSAKFLREALRRAKMTIEELNRRHAAEEEIRRERAKVRRTEEARRAEELKQTHVREQKPGSIGEYARDLLRRQYAGVPYSYDYILGRIKDRYPKAKTTVASLRWYENDMRSSDLYVPRKRPAKG